MGALGRKGLLVGRTAPLYVIALHRMVAGMVSNVGVGAGAAAVGAVLRSQWFTCTCNPHTTELTNGFHADCQNCSKATGLLKHNQKLTFNNAMSALIPSIYF